ncbi:acetolactate synthase [Halobacillus kuroshimensis]|uniref:Acetolactate synthase n=2 Tax=Halobacillus kuroshimensis TaxID=302481 RepID=A0ABS3DU06_9BACI|nr:acetolactate synthase [Halobacillus kuroshimensis]
MKQAVMSSARAIVECIKMEGVRHIFCVPGESFLPVLDAISRERSMQLISARHEGGASFMAEAYGKAGSCPGVVMATRGVGAANLAIGVHTAAQDSTPLVVLLGQVHSSFKGREGFQEVDLEAFFKPIAKWVAEIREPPRTTEIIQRAFRIAQTGRPGPVVVSLPEDVLNKEALMTFGPAVTIPAPAPSDEEVEAVKTALNSAVRPVVIAGGGIKRAGAEQELVSFAERFSLPVVTAFRRHDSFPNDHRLYAGHLGLGTDAEILETVRQADTIVAVGTRLSEITTQDYKLLTPDHKVIHIDIDEQTIGSVHPPFLGVAADARQTLKKLRSMDITAGWISWAEQRRLKYERTLTNAGRQMLNGRVIECLQNKLKENSVITNDAGNFAGWIHSFFVFRHPHSYVGPTSGAMGYGLPAALGVKLASPDKTVVSLSGDGGFMMTMQEVETAVRYNIPVISLVFNNRMYGTIRMHQEMHYPHQVAGTDLGEVRFSKIARHMGAEGFYVQTAEEFEGALEKALRSNVPVVIEIECDPEQISLNRTISSLRSNQ